MWELAHEEDGGAHSLTLVGESAHSLTVTAFGRRLRIKRDVHCNVQVCGLPVRGTTAVGVDLDAIAKRALEGTGFTLEAVRSRVVFRALVAARARVYVELRHAGFAYSQIGAFLHRDHSTVLALCRKYYYPPGGNPPAVKLTVAQANTLARAARERSAA